MSYILNFKKMKKERGQFYTKNANYIFQGLAEFIPNDAEIIEPFVGEGDLIFVLDNGRRKFHCYDIDDKGFDKITCQGEIHLEVRDTLESPPNYEDKWIITNPPFLGRNKSPDKYYFDLYNQNDLYKCAIKSFIEQNVLGGIIILPLNFWSSPENWDLRREFLEKFHIFRLNIFEEKIFSDTSYTVCCFSFGSKNNFERIIDRGLDEDKIYVDSWIFPDLTTITLEFGEFNNWTLGYELFNKTSKKYKISRLRLGLEPNTCLLVKCIDDDTRINMSISNKFYFGKDSDRSYLTLHITPEINPELQRYVSDKFNQVLNFYRDKYHSLFLTNYRESNKNGGRKRIGFELIYSIVALILDGELE